jgi:hypothetical protein
MMKLILPSLLIVTMLIMPGCGEEAPALSDWAQGAVWYQIFPERFRNAIPDSDPVKETWTLTSADQVFLDLVKQAQRQ